MSNWKIAMTNDTSIFTPKRTKAEQYRVWQKRYNMMRTPTIKKVTELEERNNKLLAEQLKRKEFEAQWAEKAWSEEKKAEFKAKRKAVHA